MARFKDMEWGIDGKGPGSTSWEGAKLAVLMDIRDELQKLNALMHCHNTMAIPELLRSIKRNTTKPKRREVKP